MVKEGIITNEGIIAFLTLNEPSDWVQYFLMFIQTQLKNEIVYMSKHSIDFIKSLLPKLSAPKYITQIYTTSFLWTKKLDQELRYLTIFTCMYDQY